MNSARSVAVEVLNGTWHRRWVVGMEHVLGPGDSYHFDASVPHGYEAASDETVRVMWVGTMRSLSIRDNVRPAATNPDTA